MSYQDRHPQSRPRAPLKPLLAALLAGVAIAVLFVAGIAAQRFGNRQPAAAAVTGPAGTSPAKTARLPGIGTAVRDGKFEFVVSRVDCSRTTVGLEHLKRTADGKYCVVSLSVRNIGDASRYFLGHAQKAYDSSGASYGNDELAGVYANRDTQTFLQKLTPGERTSGKLVFDVPRTVKLVRLTLHDSLLSGGADVTVG